MQPADPGWGGSETDGIDLTGDRQTSPRPQETASGRNPGPAWDRGETEAEEDNPGPHRLLSLTRIQFYFPSWGTQSPDLGFLCPWDMTENGATGL